MAKTSVPRRKAALSPAVPLNGMLNSPLSILMHRLEMASFKLDLVVAHYPDPGKCNSEDMGAIALTRDVARELDSLYCEFNDFVQEAGLAQKGPWLDRFPEDLPTPETADGEGVQS